MEKWQRWLLQCLRTTTHSPWLPFLSSLHGNVRLKYQAHLFSLLKWDLFLWLSNLWPLKMINSLLSKVENYAWFGEHFQAIGFRLGQQVRVPWRFERTATDTQHSVLIGIIDSYIWGAGQNHCVKRLSFDHKIQQVPWENLITTWYKFYLKFMVEKKCF